MQAYPDPKLTGEEAEKLKEKLGFADDPIPFDEEIMKRAVEHKDIDRVEIFSLKKGMIVNAGGHRYKVTAVRPNGKITLRPMKDPTP